MYSTLMVATVNKQDPNPKVLAVYKQITIAKVVADIALLFQG